MADCWLAGRPAVICLQSKTIQKATPLTARRPRPRAVLPLDCGDADPGAAGNSVEIHLLILHASAACHTCKAFGGIQLARGAVGAVCNAGHTEVCKCLTRQVTAPATVRDSLHPVQALIVSVDPSWAAGKAQFRLNAQQRPVGAQKRGMHDVCSSEEWASPVYVFY